MKKKIPAPVAFEDPANAMLMENINSKSQQVADLKKEIAATKMLLKQTKKGKSKKPFYRTWFGRGVNRSIQFLTTPFVHAHNNATDHLDHPDACEMGEIIGDVHHAIKKYERVNAHSKKAFHVIRKLAKLQVEAERFANRKNLDQSALDQMKTCVDMCKTKISMLRPKQEDSNPDEFFTKVGMLVEALTEEIEHLEEDHNGEHSIRSSDSDNSGSNHHLFEAPQES